MIRFLFWEYKDYKKIENASAKKIPAQILRKVINMNWQNIIKSKEARRLADIAEDNGLTVIEDKGYIEMIPSKYASTKFTYGDLSDTMVFYIDVGGDVFYRNTEFDYDDDEEFVELVKRYIKYIETDKKEELRRLLNRTRISRDNPSEGQMIQDADVEKVAKDIIEMLDIDELEDIKMSIEEEFDL